MAQAGERCAVEPIIWAMPTVNYYLTRQEMLVKTLAKGN